MSTLTMTQDIKPISIAKAKEISPAMFATKPAEYINLNRYKFTPTTEVLSHMNTLGWQLTNVKQSKTKIALRKNFGVHICEFQHPDLYIKDQTGGIEARPTIVLLNSHDGSRPISFDMGLFRLVCTNGLMIKDRDFGGFKERHTKYTLQEIKDIIDGKVTALPTVIEKINQWSGKIMTAKERRAFATDAILLRIAEDRVPEDYELMDILQPKRKADEGNTLWTVFNTVQENLIKGGYQMNNRTARPITNPIQDMVLNKGLWEIADKYMTPTS